MAEDLEKEVDNENEKEFDHFYSVVNYIATYYILTMDFKSLKQLEKKEYCDNLVVLTADIMDRYLTTTDVDYLYQRFHNDEEIDEHRTENISYIMKDRLDRLDISNDEKKGFKKKQVCFGIAKFYVKIAHLFAAIVMTINPMYSYTDAHGNVEKVGLLEKDRIPKGSKRKMYKKFNICDNRIKALKQNEVIDVTTGKVTIQPKICSMNLKKVGQKNVFPKKGTVSEELEAQEPQEQQEPQEHQEPQEPQEPQEQQEPQEPTESQKNVLNNQEQPNQPNQPNQMNEPNNNDYVGGSSNNFAKYNNSDKYEPKSLNDEPGIPDLKKLYLDANYDYKKGYFTSMSEDSRKQYETDLELFYNTFTGNKMTPELKAQIKDFSDIKLRDYRKTANCQNGKMQAPCTLNKTADLYVKYAENIQKMIEKAADNQSQLLEIINALFTYVIDPYTKKKVIIISPKLNNGLLQENIVKARRIISKLYIECEEYYVEGVKLYEAIVEAKICETTQNQIDALEAESTQLMQNM